MCSWKNNGFSEMEKFAESRKYPTWVCIALTAFLAIIVILLLTSGDRGQEIEAGEVDHDFDRCTCDGFAYLPRSRSRSQCHCARGGCERR